MSSVDVKEGKVEIQLTTRIRSPEVAVMPAGDDEWERIKKDLLPGGEGYVCATSCLQSLVRGSGVTLHKIIPGFYRTLPDINPKNFSTQTKYEGC